jgi:hypothetical protein
VAVSAAAAGASFLSSGFVSGFSVMPIHGQRRSISIRYLGWLTAYTHGSRQDTILQQMAGYMVIMGVNNFLGGTKINSKFCYESLTELYGELDSLKLESSQTDKQSSKEIFFRQMCFEMFSFILAYWSPNDPTKATAA